MMNSRILFFCVRSLVLLTSFFLGSCTAIAEKNLLKFPVKALLEEPKTEKIPAEKVTADIRDLTGFAVDEDVLITTSMFGSDYGLDVFDRTSGKILHPLCRIGRGPGEFLSIFPPFSITDSAVLVYDGGTGMFSEVCIAGDQVGAIAHQVKLEVPPGQGIPIIASSHKVGEKELLVYNSIQAPFEAVSIENPYYAIYDYEKGSEKRALHLFDASPLNHSSEGATMAMFNLHDCVNREKTSVCFAMGAMPVFGFLDIASGKAKGFRLKGKYDLSANESRIFFSDVCANDQFIYALYLGKRSSELSAEGSTTVLFKLDWNGHILKKYELDGVYMGCNATSDRLYLSKAEDSRTWGLYQLDIRKL